MAGEKPNAMAVRTKAFARALRQGMTDAEQRLWWGLRKRNVEGFKFRRQCPIGSYVADFCCLEAKLIVEVDGSQHAELQREHDERRTAWLESQGFKIIRFWNWDVLDNPDHACEVVLAAAKGRVSEDAKPSRRRRILAARRKIYAESKK
jgi:very-short-patch-repair endonuclease